VAAGVVIAGFLSSGLLEYIVHRWVLHGPPSMAKRGHAQHHAEPRALISTPLFVMMTGALAIWGVLGLVLPAGLAALLVFELYAAYNYFALVHHGAVCSEILLDRADENAAEIHPHFHSRGTDCEV
jgi:hypothetical protein